MTAMMKVKVPEGLTTFSHNGVKYRADEKGTAEVPREALPELSAHGILPSTDEADVKTFATPAVKSFATAKEKRA